jgi:hypothetical protein
MIPPTAPNTMTSNITVSPPPNTNGVMIGGFSPGGVLPPPLLPGVFALVTVIWIALK